jgi:hypothetical protein
MQTTEKAYPKMFPVNSAHASAPRFEIVSDVCVPGSTTYMVRRGHFALVYRDNSATEQNVRVIEQIPSDGRTKEGQRQSH